MRRRSAYSKCVRRFTTALISSCSWTSAARVSKSTMEARRRGGCSQGARGPKVQTDLAKDSFCLEIFELGEHLLQQVLHRLRHGSKRQWDRSGDRSGDPSGDRSGDPSGDRSGGRRGDRSGDRVRAGVDGAEPGGDASPYTLWSYRAPLSFSSSNAFLLGLASKQRCPTGPLSSSNQRLPARPLALSSCSSMPSPCPRPRPLALCLLLVLFLYAFSSSSSSSSSSMPSPRPLPRPLPRPRPLPLPLPLPLPPSSSSSSSSSTAPRGVFIHVAISNLIERGGRSVAALASACPPPLRFPPLPFLPSSPLPLPLPPSFLLPFSFSLALYFHARSAELRQVDLRIHPLTHAAAEGGREEEHCWAGGCGGESWARALPASCSRAQPPRPLPAPVPSPCALCTSAAHSHLLA